ncbi:MAG: hypothetical protein HQ562_01655 [Candidatus Marinimicrobia bacterium]|nr:hypothetical protein [Candidatus Neomarinimicrobiota bacterium]
MKKVLFVLLIILFWVSGQSVGPEESLATPIAVLTLEGKGVTQQEAEILTERLRSALVQDGRYQVVERTQMETILAEQGFQQSGCMSNECLIQAGLILGVQQMVGGTVGKIGSSYAVDLRLFDVETSEIIKAVTRNYQGAIDGLLAIMSEVAVDLANDESLIDQQLSEQLSFDTRSDPETVVAILENGIKQIKDEFAATSQRNPSPLDNESWSPIQFALAYPQQMLPESVKIYGFRFNLVYGKNHSVYGIDIGLINELNHDLMGLQGGLNNQADRVFGLQYGVLNTCSQLYGAQAGLVNKSKSTKGCQIGLINYSDRLTGIQIGLINRNPGGSGQAALPIINIGF